MSALRDEFERRTGYIIQPGESVIELPGGGFSVLKPDDPSPYSNESDRTEDGSSQ